MKKQTLRVGVIGTGFIGPVHMEALRRLGIQVVAVCGSKTGAGKVAAEFRVKGVYGDYNYRSMLDCEDLDVVHIATPNKMHFIQASDALKAGKHVICEKPLAMNAKESALLVQMTKRSKSIFAVNYNIRFYPAVLQMKQSIGRGDIGEVIHVGGSYLQDWLLYPTDYNWRLLPEEGGALRAVADIGTHWMDTVSFLLGSRIQSVQAHLETFHKTRKRPVGEVKTFAKSNSNQRYKSYEVGTEDFASLMLCFENGVHGNCMVSQVAAGRKNCVRIEVYGSKGSVCWNSEEPDFLHFGSRDQGNTTRQRATPGFAEDIAGFTDYPAGHVEGFSDTFKMLYRSVYADIVEDGSRKPLYATVDDGHHEVKVCEAILESAKKRKWISIR